MNDLERQTLQVLAALLRYPDDAFAEDPLGDGEGERALDFLPPAPARVLRRFIREAGGRGGASASAALDALRADYVRTFDFDSGCGLHLAWHRYGDRPELGRALAGLNELYRDAGFVVEPGELPDYLPRMLEFVAVGPEWAGRIALEGFGGALRKVAGNVIGRHPESAYAPLLALALRLLGLADETGETGEMGQTGSAGLAALEGACAPEPQCTRRPS